MQVPGVTVGREGRHDGRQLEPLEAPALLGLVGRGRVGAVFLTVRVVARHELEEFVE